MKTSTVGVWQDKRIWWDFTTNVYGGFPASASVLRPFIDKKIADGKIRAPRTSIELGADGRVEMRSETPSIEALHEMRLQEALETVPEAEELIEERTLVFRRLEGALAFWGGSLRSHIKECARTLSSLLLPKKEKGSGGPSSLAVRATNGLYVAEDWIALLRGDQRMAAPEGIEEFMVHVRDPRTGAPMSSIKHCEFVSSPCSFVFTLKVLGGIVTDQELDMIFSYGAVHGFGQERSRGMGRYLFTIEQ